MDEFQKAHFENVIGFMVYAAAGMTFLVWGFWILSWIAA